MTNHTPLKTRSVEESYFKSTADGYLFETPSPWIFAPSRRYIVNDEQKQMLLGVLKPRRSALFIGLISAAIIAFTCGVSVLWATFSPRNNPNALDLFGMAVSLLVPLYAVAVMWTRQGLRRIEPIVSAAVSTSAKMTLGERANMNGDALSTKALVVITLCFFLSAVAASISFLTTTHGHVLRADARSYLSLMNAVIFLMLTALWGLNLRRRLRSSS